jgi:UDPglucose 6-dehydrogenase
MARRADYAAELIEAVESVNDRQKRVLFDKIVRHFDGQLRGRTFALWGLAFKPNTDDMREAPSRVLMELLWEAGAKVRAYDPEAGEEAGRIYGQRSDLVLCRDPYDALQQADGLAICTEWRVFRSPDLERIKSTLREPVVFDGRNIYDPKVVTAMGLRYYGIGRSD